MDGYLDCCSNKECDPRASALKAIKDNYMSENPRAQQSNVINEIETTVLIEAKKNGHRKGVGVVLYCMTGPNTCENIILNLKQSLNCSSALSGCITMMKVIPDGRKRLCAMSFESGTATRPCRSEGRDAQSDGFCIQRLCPWCDRI